MSVGAVFVIGFVVGFVCGMIIASSGKKALIEENERLVKDLVKAKAGWR